MIIELDDKTFKVDKLSVRDQFHVSRRLTPLLQSFIPIVKTVMVDLGKKLDEQEDKQVDFKELAVELFNENQDSIVNSVSKFTDIISSLPDEQLDYIMDKCLSVCHWKNDKAYVPVLTNPDNFSMEVNFKLMFYVIKDSLGGFIQGLATKVEGVTAQS